MNDGPKARAAVLLMVMLGMVIAALFIAYDHEGRIRELRDRVAALEARP